MPMIWHQNFHHDRCYVVLGEDVSILHIYWVHSTLCTNVAIKTQNYKYWKLSCALIVIDKQCDIGR